MKDPRLEFGSTCEHCNKVLLPDSFEARICSCGVKQGPGITDPFGLVA